MTQEDPYTQIQIKKTTRARLKGLLEYERESYDQEINRLLDELERLRGEKA
jgi:hypothetical protein